MIKEDYRRNISENEHIFIIIECCLSSGLAANDADAAKPGQQVLKKKAKPIVAFLVAAVCLRRSWHYSYQC